MEVTGHERFPDGTYRVTVDNATSYMFPAYDDSWTLHEDGGPGMTEDFYIGQQRTEALALAAAVQEAAERDVEPVSIL